jgi:hypothetical protein
VKDVDLKEEKDKFYSLFMESTIMHTMIASIVRMVYNVFPRRPPSCFTKILHS